MTQWTAEGVNLRSSDGRKVFARTALDFRSAEFEAASLTHADRVDMLLSLGFDGAVTVLEHAFLAQAKPYRAKQVIEELLESLASRLAETEVDERDKADARRRLAELDGASEVGESEDPLLVWLERAGLEADLSPAPGRDRARMTLNPVAQRAFRERERTWTEERVRALRAGSEPATPLDHLLWMQLQTRECP